MNYNRGKSNKYTFSYGKEIMFPGAQGYEDDTEVRQILPSLPDGKPFL